MQISDRAKIDARIAGAFKVASETTGTSFERLARTAARESDVRPDLASSTSSAKGLFQFVDQTWFELIKKEGPSVGLERLADQISSDGKGGYTIADPKEKAKILALKTDPLVSSIMAGRFTEANAKSLTESLGRAPSDGEVYAAHVLGASGAAKLVRMAETEPTTTASLAFPKAAAANPALFYGKDGKPRTAAELLGSLTRTGADASSRIAEAHAAAATTTTPKLDPRTLAALVRAQATAKVGGEGLAGDGLDRLTADRFAKTALAEKSLPGASRDIVPAQGARVDGWRAKTSRDAFAVLMRSDGETLAADAATAAGPAATAAEAAPIRFAAGGSLPSRIGGVAGGIPYVDPNQPMRLVADPAQRGKSIAPAIGQPVGARPSRVLTAAATGAPAMPLPMVESGMVVRTSRVTAVSTAPSGAEDAPASGLVASGAARVKTVSIAPAAPAGSSSSRPLLPPVPGEKADPSAPAVPTLDVAPARAATRSNRPLDLLGLQRRAVAAAAGR